MHKSKSLTDEQDIIEKEKRLNVYQEIIEAEQSYVDAMEVVLFYKEELRKAEASGSVSPLIKEQAHIIFANTKDLHKFHSKYLLPAIESCRKDPISVAEVFTIYSKDLIKLYSIYIQNYKAQSSLAIEIGKDEFFVACDQKRLDTIPLLPYTSYLLYPVQRIAGKYGLLFVEMLKNTTRSEDRKRLQDAIKVLKSVATIVNGVHFSPLITKYPGKLYKEGKLIMSGTFRVTYTDRRHPENLIQRIKHAVKHRERLISMYERCIIFSKERQPKNPETGQMYEFKKRYEFGQFDITENISGKPEEFEVWTDGREEVYNIAAPDIPTKEIWVVSLSSQIAERNARRQNC